LETGQLKNSIGITLYENRAVIGTNDPTAAYREFGTKNEPPRSFMLNAGLEATKQIEKSAQKYINAALRGQGMHSTDLRTVLHRVRLILKIARESEARR
jgi:phage gpG-like protein